MQLRNSLPILDARLCAAADFVKDDSVAADIGCDHGKLAAVLSRKCKKVIAVDSKKAPLAMAMAQMEKCGITNVECRMGNGVSCLAEKEADTIIIAGLSAETICGILAAAPWLKSAESRLVLAPATKPHVLRDWLYKNGFSLLEEKAVKAQRRYYTVMHAGYTGICKNISLYESVRGKVVGEHAVGYLNNQALRLFKTSQGKEKADYAVVANLIFQEVEQCQA